MKSKKTYWLIVIVSVLLISLLINQIIYVYQAAVEQETSFNNKVNVALTSIVNKVSDDYDVCQKISAFAELDNTTLCNLPTNNSCSTSFKSREEWQNIDALIQTELKALKIDLKYKFDFCNNNQSKLHNQDNKNTYTKNLENTLPKSGIIMHLEFPSKSNYVLHQMGPVFISSILIIVLISIILFIAFQFYNKEKKNAEKTKDFLNNMTHEFKTPLANITFANSILRRKSAEITPENIKKYTEIIASENKKIIDSSEDILEMAKQEYDFTKLVLEKIDVHNVIYDLQKSFMGVRADALINISLDLNATAFTVKGKVSFLYNALSNIVDNAIKYCLVLPEISIVTFNEKGFLCVAITDNGIGINKNELALVFDKFYRISTGNTHDVKGFGLGLPYVKMIIEQMKGNVTLKSSLGKGTSFTIKLPIYD